KSDQTPAPLLRRLFGNRRLRSGQPGDRDTGRRATDVIQPDRVAEHHARRVAAIFATYADLEVATRFSAACHSHLHQAADAVLSDRLERIGPDDVVLGVVGDERPVVVAADTETGLRQVVRAEREELGALRDLIGADRRAGHFDHRPYEVFHLLAGFF